MPAKFRKVCSCEKDKSTVRAVIYGTGKTLTRALFMLKGFQNFGGLFPGGKIVKNYFDGKHQKKNYDAQNPRLPKKTGLNAGQNADDHNDREHGSKWA